MDACAFVRTNPSLWQLDERIGLLAPIEIHSFGDELIQANYSN
jgi:hypothetical protein